MGRGDISCYFILKDGLKFVGQSEVWDTVLSFHIQRENSVFDILT